MRTTEHFVKLDFSLGFTNKELLHLLTHQQHIIISVRTLKRICKKLLLFRRKNHRALEEITFFLCFVFLQILENLCLYCHKCLKVYSQSALFSSLSPTTRSYLAEHLCTMFFCTRSSTFSPLSSSCG